MAALRKMLGDVNSKTCLDIMALISAQSQKTVEKWAVEYAAENVLPLYNARCPEETVPARLIEACREYMNGVIKLSEIKPVLSEGRKYSAGVKGDVEQAAARAVATACASITTPTNAFGFLMYAAAAAAYSELGLKACREEYDEFAAREMEKALDSLKKVAVENEPNPVKADWHC